MLGPAQTIDHGINLPVFEHVFLSGPSVCFHHICGLQYPFVALRSPWVYECFVIDARGRVMVFVVDAICFAVA